MMDTTILRIGAQVALVVWCAATATVLLHSRGRSMHAAGHYWAWLALACFAIWMFASALSTKGAEMFPRSSLLWLFALVELGTAAGAWGWLGAYVRSNFQFHTSKPRVMS